MDWTSMDWPVILLTALVFGLAAGFVAWLLVELYSDRF